MWVTVWVNENEVEKLNKEFPVNRYVYMIEYLVDERGPVKRSKEYKTLEEAIKESIHYNDWGCCGKGNCTIKKINGRGRTVEAWKLSGGKPYSHWKEGWYNSYGGYDWKRI